MIPYRIKHLALPIDMGVSPSAGAWKSFKASGCSGSITVSS